MYAAAPIIGMTVSPAPRPRYLRFSDERRLRGEAEMARSRTQRLRDQRERQQAYRDEQRRLRRPGRDDIARVALRWLILWKPWSSRALTGLPLMQRLATSSTDTSTANGISGARFISAPGPKRTGNRYLWRSQAMRQATGASQTPSAV